MYSGPCRRGDWDAHLESTLGVPQGGRTARRNSAVTSYFFAPFRFFHASCSDFPQGPRDAGGRTPQTEASYSGKLVDLVGIEPTTSSMPWKRAPSCATGPLEEGIPPLRDPTILAQRKHDSQTGEVCRSIGRSVDQILNSNTRILFYYDYKKERSITNL